MAMAADPPRVVAVDVGGTSLKGSLIARTGASEAFARRLTPAAAGPQAVIEAVLSLAEDLSQERPRPVAAGLTVPGLVREQTGSVLTAANLGWREVAASGDALFGPLRREVPAHLRFGEPPPVVAASLGTEATRYGAAIAAWRAAGIEDAELGAWMTGDAAP